MATRVLFVDDSEDVLDLNEEILSRAADYEVKTALSGARALEIVSEWHPDLVVTDIIMPEMSGLELITRIRTEVPPPLPIIVAMSGFRELESDAIYRGAFAFHLKPIASSELLTIVQSALARATPARGLREQANDRRTRLAADGASAALEHAKTLHSDLVDRVRLTCRILSTYFDDVVCVLMLMSDTKLTVLASSSPTCIAEGASSDGFLRIAPEVIESGSTLVVPDLELLPSLRAATPGSSFRFVVSAPIRVSNGVVAGSLTLLDYRPRQFSGSELAIVKHIARWGSEVLSGARWRVMFTECGLLQPRNWLTWFAEEFDRARALGRAIGVAMFAPAESAIDYWEAVALWDLLAPHTALAAMADGVIAAYTIADDVSAADSALDRLREGIENTWGVKHGAIVTHDRHALPTEPRAAIQLAQGVLETARRQGPGTVVLRAAVRSHEHVLASP